MGITSLFFGRIVYRYLTSSVRPEYFLSSHLSRFSARPISPRVQVNKSSVSARVPGPFVISLRQSEGREKGRRKQPSVLPSARKTDEKVRSFNQTAPGDLSGRPMRILPRHVCSSAPEYDLREIPVHARREETIYTKLTVECISGRSIPDANARRNSLVFIQALRHLKTRDHDANTRSNCSTIFQLCSFRCGKHGTRNSSVVALHSSLIDSSLQHVRTLFISKAAPRVTCCFNCNLPPVRGSV